MAFFIVHKTTIILLNMTSALDKKVKELASIKDGWGGIDKKILKLVAALNLLGVKTSISCAGHASHGSPFPYVTFRGSRAVVEKLLAKFYKKHKSKKSSEIEIFKGKASFWIYSGEGFSRWKNEIDKKVVKIKNGEKIKPIIITKKQKLVRIKNLLLYQKEMTGFAEFLKEKIA